MVRQVQSTQSSRRQRPVSSCVMVAVVLVMGQTLLSLIVPHRADVPTRAVVMTDWHFHGKTYRTWSYWVRHSLTIKCSFSAMAL